MSETALIVRDDGRRAVASTRHWEGIKEDALARAALIGRVANPDEQQDAVSAEGVARTALRDLEKARVAAKEPYLEMGKKIDAHAKVEAKELETEVERLAALTRDYQQLERAKVLAAENARRLEEQRLERLRQAELARIAAEERAAKAKLDAEKAEADRKAREAKNAAEAAAAAETQREIERQQALAASTSIEQMAAVNDRFSEQSAALPIYVAPKAEGQTTKPDVDFEITDLWLLARSHRTCVDITPRKSEIKELLKAGVTLAGVRSWNVVRSTVRASREPAAIEIGGRG